MRSFPGVSRQARCVTGSPRRATSGRSSTAWGRWFPLPSRRLEPWRLTYGGNRFWPFMAYRRAEGCGDAMTAHEVTARVGDAQTRSGAKVAVFACGCILRWSPTHGPDRESLPTYPEVLPVAA